MSAAYFPNQTVTVHPPTIDSSYGNTTTTWPTPPNTSIGSYEVDAQPAGDQIVLAAGLTAREEAYEVFGPPALPVNPRQNRLAWGGRQYRIIKSEVWDEHAWALVVDAGPTA